MGKKSYRNDKGLFLSNIDKSVVIKNIGHIIIVTYYNFISAITKDEGLEVAFLKRNSKYVYIYWFLF